jgi:hypothetical protein
MPDKAIGSILDHVVPLLNTDVDREKFPKMHDPRNSEMDGSPNIPRRILANPVAIMAEDNSQAADVAHLLGGFMGVLV